jgi:hypothetical protein
MDTTAASQLQDIRTEWARPHSLEFRKIIEVWVWNDPIDQLSEACGLILLPSALNIVSAGSISDERFVLRASFPWSKVTGFDNWKNTTAGFDEEDMDFFSFDIDSVGKFTFQCDDGEEIEQMFHRLLALNAEEACCSATNGLQRNQISDACDSSQEEPEVTSLTRDTEAEASDACTCRIAPPGQTAYGQKFKINWQVVEPAGMSPTIEMPKAVREERDDVCNEQQKKFEDRLSFFQNLSNSDAGMASAWQDPVVPDDARLRGHAAQKVRNLRSKAGGVQNAQQAQSPSNPSTSDVEVLGLGGQYL